MPALSPTILFSRFQDSLSAAGWQWLRTSAALRPRDYRIWRDGDRIDLKVYLWTLTPGGKGRPMDEWRIQPTSVPAFERAPGVATLILGYASGRDVFAGFDAGAHADPLGSSPSIQIKERALEDAVATGLALHFKSSAELVFAIRPDLLGLYIEHLEALHDATLAPGDLKLLEAMTADPAGVNPDDIEATTAPPERRRVLRTVLRFLRDQRFRSRVLIAYRHRCGVCGIQLDLLDAAHIVPVGQPGSTDEVSNGVAMCALHHRAYDRALIAFDTSFDLHISEARLDELTLAGRDGGFAPFAAALRKTLLLPATPADRPDPALIRTANVHRGLVLS